MGTPLSPQKGNVGTGAPGPAWHTECSVHQWLWLPPLAHTTTGLHTAFVRTPHPTFLDCKVRWYYLPTLHQRRSQI